MTIVCLTVSGLTRIICHWRLRLFISRTATISHKAVYENESVKKHSYSIHKHLHAIRRKEAFKCWAALQIMIFLSCTFIMIHNPTQVKEKRTIKYVFFFSLSLHGINSQLAPNWSCYSLVFLRTIENMFNWFWQTQEMSFYLCRCRM